MGVNAHFFWVKTVVMSFKKSKCGIEEAEVAARNVVVQKCLIFD